MPIFVLYRVSVDFNMHVLCVYVCVGGGGGGDNISISTGPWGTNILVPDLPNS